MYGNRGSMKREGKKKGEFNPGILLGETRLKNTKRLNGKISKKSPVES